MTRSLEPQPGWNSRSLKVAAAQVGAVQVGTKKKEIVDRLTKLLQQAIFQGVHLVVFPETAFTTYVPRLMNITNEYRETFFEQGDDITENEDVAPLFSLAAEHKVDLYIGYNERTPDGQHFNTCIYFSGHKGKPIRKYRKAHLSGPGSPSGSMETPNYLEAKAYDEGTKEFKSFRVPYILDGTLRQATLANPAKVEGSGDPIVGMMISNDRHWAEAWRTYGKCHRNARRTTTLILSAQPSKPSN